MELNVGYYIRTKKGAIAKILRINSTGSISCDKNVYQGINIFNTKKILCDLSTIIKSSPNIIDLIEEDDYVNGEKVIYVGYSMYKETKSGLKGIGDKIVIIGIYNKWGFDKKTLKERDIKNIVTREQFEAIKYEVE